MTGRSPLETLASARASRAVIQDFCPLADSIEWQLGQRYWRERGNKAFIGDAQPVPYLINNDGNLSRNAAEVVFASLAAAERDGTLEPEIFALELGIGVGLFARFFLDNFRLLCEERGTDYYDRLHYVAGDYSAAMLADAGRHGIFAHHPGRYLLRQVNALCPEQALSADAIFGEPADRPFRAVFLNYLLDCLPPTVLRLEGEEVQQLCVRTCLARGVTLGDHTDAGVEDLARWAKSSDPGEQAEFLALFSLFASDYTYCPVALADIPHGDFATRFARQAGHRSILHNFGALQCLERLLGLVREGGFILINDYGNIEVAGAEEFQHQRFSQSTSVGINFPLLEAYFQGAAHAHWLKPEEGDGKVGIHARLLGRQVAAETAECFQERLSKAARDRFEEPVLRARNCVKGGRFEAALAAYQQALERQPQNWALMKEVADLLASSLQSPLQGLEMARAGLACNPACSAELWNVLGDCLYFLGRLGESEQAYHRALQVNAADVRAHYNLAFVHHQTRQYGRALQCIAEGLALDGAGTYRDGFLKKQSEVLVQLSLRYQHEQRRLGDRVSTPQEPMPPAATGLLGPQPPVDAKQHVAHSAPMTPGSTPVEGGTRPRP
jgi:tetratricopeptide (TPR) repeat protein